MAYYTRGGGGVGRRLTAIIVMVAMITSVAALGAAGTASATNAGPEIICCGNFFTDSVQVNATSATINFTAAFTGYSPITLEWGNTSVGDVFSQQASYSSTTLKGSIYLSYLQPNTTYGFNLLAGGGGTCIHGTVEYYCYLTSSFTTTADSYGAQPGGDHWIMVNVTNPSGALAPNGMSVQYKCLGYNGNGLVGGGTTGNTQSGRGWAGFDIPPDSQCAHGLRITVLNGQGATLWPGYFNESVDMFAAQPVYIVLPANYVGPYLPQVLDFSNYNYTNSLAGWSDIQYTQTTTYTDSATTAWSFTAYPGSFTVEASGSSTQSYTFTTSSTDASANGSLDVAASFWTSGTIEFSAMSREWASTSVNEYGSEVSELSPPPNPTVDWMYPGTNVSGVAVLNGWNQIGLGPGGTKQGSVYVDGTTTTNYRLSAGYDLTVVIEGVSVKILDVNYGFSLSSTTTSSKTLSWSVTVPQTADGGHYTCFNVYGSGESPSGGYDDTIGIWQYAPLPNDTCQTP